MAEDSQHRARAGVEEEPRATVQNAHCLRTTETTREIHAPHEARDEVALAARSFFDMEEATQAARSA